LEIFRRKRNCSTKTFDVIKSHLINKIKDGHSVNRPLFFIFAPNKKSIKNKKNMTDPKTLSSVAEFHKTFQHPILDTPTIPSEQRCALRVSLIAEELKELEEAIQDKDLVEIADALCDIQYVLAGAVLEFGLKDKFSALFDEVQRSNMSKACNDEAEAIATQEHYKLKGVESYYKEVDGKFLVFRTADNKTLKSINYSPADLKTIVEG